MQYVQVLTTVFIDTMMRIWNALVTPFGEMVVVSPSKMCCVQFAAHFRSQNHFSQTTMTIGNVFYFSAHFYRKSSSMHTTRNHLSLGALIEVQALSLSAGNDLH